MIRRGGITRDHKGGAWKHKLRKLSVGKLKDGIDPVSKHLLSIIFSLSILFSSIVLTNVVHM